MARRLLCNLFSCNTTGRTVWLTGCSNNKNKNNDDDNNNLILLQRKVHMT